MNISKVNAIKWTALLLVVLVQLLTVALLKNTERFYVEKQQLLQDPEFVQGKTTWQQDGKGFVQHNGKSISIVNDSRGYHAIFQNVEIEQPGHYTVSFDAATTDVKGAAKNYGSAEVVVVYRTALGGTNGHGKKVFSATGTRDMAPYSLTLHLGRDIGSVDIAARLNNASGKFSIANPTVSRLQELPLYKKVKAGLILLWVLIFAGLAIVALRVFSRVQAIALGATLGVAIVGVLLPEGVMTSLNGVIATILPTSLIAGAGRALAGLFGYSELAGAGAGVGKMGHFAVFLCIGIIAGANFRKIGILFSLAAIAAFAFLTEALQLLVVGRTTSINDFFIDFTAGAIGLCLGLAIYLFFGGPSVDNNSQDGGANHSLNGLTKIKNWKTTLKSLKP